MISLLFLIAVPLLYGPEFHQTIWLGFILLPGTLMLGVAKISARASLAAATHGTRSTVRVSRAAHARALLRPDPAFHAWGAAIGSSLSYASALVGLVFFRRVTAIGLREASVPRATTSPTTGPRRAWRAAPGDPAMSARTILVVPAWYPTARRPLSGPFVRDQFARPRPTGTGWSCSSTGAEAACAAWSAPEDGTESCGSSA